MPIRSPIVAVLGHVDHGKTTILDAIRGSAVAKREAGGITQMIGASYISRNDLETLSKRMGGSMKFDLKIPGLLFIDTPGHEAFTNLRDRGGSIADIAIVVVDVNTGFQPQTKESIRILKQYRTPFVIAANKMDTISGWKSYPDSSFISSYSRQPEHIRNRLDEKIYVLMGNISEFGFDSERFDRVNDFTKNIGIVPVSAKNREGLNELLVLIAGLSQKFLEGKLEIEESGRGKGSIIEVKEEKGLGETIDVILYDGVLKKGDEILFLTKDGVSRTKVRGLLEPSIGKSGKEKYRYVDSIAAAAGVKVYAPDLKGAIPGSPIEVIKDFEKDRLAIEKQFGKVFSEAREAGVTVKTDSLGSLEALSSLLRDAEVPVKREGVGKITRKDVLAAASVKKDDPYLGVVVGFNVEVLDEAWEESRNSRVPIIWSNIIYKVIEDYKEWVKSEKDRKKKEALKVLPWPGKIKALPGCCFRVSKPAIFGIEVLGGRIRKGYRLMNRSGEIVGEIREMQKEKEKLNEVTTGEQVAISCDGILYGKNVFEGDILYIYMTGEQFDVWNSQLSMLDEGEKTVLEETKRILKKYF